jgi:Protein of unknown function (DUF1403)
MARGPQHFGRGAEFARFKNFEGLGLQPLGLSDRARRCLFKRLVALGAIRELTSRPTFRLYGL